MSSMPDGKQILFAFFRQHHPTGERQPWPAKAGGGWGPGPKPYEGGSGGEGESIADIYQVEHSRKHIKHASRVTWEELEVARAVRKTEFTSGLAAASV